MRSEIIKNKFKKRASLINIFNHLPHFDGTYHQSETVFKSSEFLDSKFVVVKGKKVKLSSLPWQLFIGLSEAGN